MSYKQSIDLRLKTWAKMFPGMFPNVPTLSTSFLDTGPNPLKPFINARAKRFDALANVLEQQSKLPLSNAAKLFWQDKQENVTVATQSPDGSIHHAVITDDGKEAVTFRWHFPRGTFTARMSALEIAEKVLGHMPHILPLLHDGPVKTQFAELLARLVLWPLQVLDEVIPWIRRLEFNEEDEILLLDLGAKPMPKPAPVFSLPTGIP